jgi:hypothetical protein
MIVQTAFDGAATADIGTAADPDGFSDGIDIASNTGFRSTTTKMTSNDLVVSVDTEMVCSIANTAGVISAGVGWAVVEYMPDLG